MPKFLSNQKIKLILIFLGIFLFKFIIVNIYYYFFKQENTRIAFDPIFDTLNLISLILFFLASLWEEFLFRYYLSFKNKAGTIWIVLISHYSIFKFFSDGSNASINMILISILISFGFMYIVSKYKESALFKLFFLSTRFKVFISAFLFSISHITSFNLSKTNLVFVASYMLILHIPSALFLSYVRLKLENGFWKGVWFHYINNILVLVLKMLDTGSV